MPTPIASHPFFQDKVNRFQSWCEELPGGRWAFYRQVLTEATSRRIPFALGGGLALMAYAGQLRETKDIDLYVQPQHKDAMIRMLMDVGLSDYYEQVPYDRKWIFRSCREDIIIDVIWAMANQRTQVDAEWLNGPAAMIDGLSLRFVRPEETLWSKLYIVQRDRCDWPDALNILYSAGSELDWDHLLARTAEDTPLLAALCTVFEWMCPAECRRLPDGVRQRLGLNDLLNEKPGLRDNARLLDSRPWFTPTLDEEHRL